MNATVVEKRGGEYRNAGPLSRSFCFCCRLNAEQRSVFSFQFSVRSGWLLDVPMFEFRQWHFTPQSRLRFRVGCPMFDVRCSAAISPGPPLHRRPTRSRHPVFSFDVGCSDVPTFDVPPQISPGPPLHRRPSIPSSSRLLLRCWMFRCSDVRCSAANLARATTSPPPHPAPPPTPNHQPPTSFFPPVQKMCTRLVPTGGRASYNFRARRVSSTLGRMDGRDAP